MAVLDVIEREGLQAQALTPYLVTRSISMTY